MTDDKTFHRSAPRPLSVYLGAAMGMLGPDADADQIIGHRAAVERMILGIRKYQSHPYRRVMPPLDVVWREGTTTLSFCPGDGVDGQRKAVLMVPSMINGSEILDLVPERSFVRWMAAQGHDIYLLDWGCPQDDDGLQTLDDGVLARLGRAAAFVAGRCGHSVDTLGYCMGGTLALAAAARAPEVFGRLVLLSAPWDFHAGDPRMMTQIMTGTPSALALLEQKPSLPVDWIQNVFAHVNPRLALDKFSAFLEMAEDGEDARIFVAAEDWLNGGQDLSAGVARSCILDWYAQNRPGRGEWVDLGVIQSRPVFVVAAARDILVPPESARAVERFMDNATLLSPDCGHISLMAGRRARESIWQPVRDWLNPLA